MNQIIQTRSLKNQVTSYQVKTCTRPRPRNHSSFHESRAAFCFINETSCTAVVTFNLKHKGVISLSLTAYLKSVCFAKIQLQMAENLTIINNELMKFCVSYPLQPKAQAAEPHWWLAAAAGGPRYLQQIVETLWKEKPVLTPKKIVGSRKPFCYIV